MADKIKELLEKNGQMIIDGSMSTALEQMGANLNCNLWTARALVDTRRRGVCILFVWQARIVALPAAIRQRFQA